jgi:hypothetical protein
MTASTICTRQTSARTKVQLLDDTSSYSPTIKLRSYGRGEGDSYAIVQYSPSCVWVAAARSYHVRTQRTARYVEIIMRSERNMWRGWLNPRPWLWYKARRRPFYPIQPYNPSDMKRARKSLMIQSNIPPPTWGHVVAPTLANPTIQPMWYGRYNRASYAIVQYSPSRVRVMTARLSHVRTQQTAK